MYRVIVAGSAGFNNYEMLNEKLSAILLSYDRSEVEIVLGSFMLGEHFAYEHRCRVVKFYTDPDRHGKSADYIRNAEMVDYASQDDGCLVAFWDGKGVEINHLVETAKGRGMTVYVFGYHKSN